MSTFWRSIGGLVLILVGLAGLALPILPGWALIFAGMAVWAKVFPWARRLEVGVRTFLAKRIPGALGELIAVREGKKTATTDPELRQTA